MSEKDNSSKGNEELLVLPHHQQFELCRTRPAYRQGRKLTAVKTYSVSSESTHLLIFGVPKINIRQELKSQLRKYGNVLSLVVKNEYPAEEFTECFHVNYDKIQSARIAKKVLDAHNFYGGSLHICYAPELETVEETRQKIVQRKVYVNKTLWRIAKQAKQDINSKQSTSLQNSSANGYYNYSQQPHAEPSSSNYNNEILNSNLVPYSMIRQKSYQYSNPKNRFVNNVITCSNVTNSNKVLPDPNAEITAGTSSDNTEIGNSLKRKSNELEYVFKRKKKRKDKTNKLENQINKLISEKEKLISEKEKSTPKEPIEDNRVTVYNQIDTPTIVNIPKQSANKIVLKINTKLI